MKMSDQLRQLRSAAANPRKYGVRFEFDCEGEPPKIFVIDEDGCEIIEVLEEPTMPGGGKLVETAPGVWSWEGDWSWNGEDWKPGPFTEYILFLLNSSQGSTSVNHPLTASN